MSDGITDTRDPLVRSMERNDRERLINEVERLRAENKRLREDLWYAKETSTKLDWALETNVKLRAAGDSMARMIDQFSARLPAAVIGSREAWRSVSTVTAKP